MKGDRTGATILQPWRRVACDVLVPTYLCVIFGAPAALIALLLMSTESVLAKAVIALLAPISYAIFFCLSAGLLALPHRKAIVEGRFPRNVAHPIYFHRRLYGLCWTSLYYFKPIYYLCLTIPLLKRVTFRLFGYKGQMEFTVYPDTWIRDLPLLDFGKGAYISNRATIGTNIAMRNGTILVGGVKVEAGALVGHLTMLAPGVKLEEKGEVSVGCAIGMSVTIGTRAFVGPCSVVDAGALFEPKSEVGSRTYVGKKAVVGCGSEWPCNSFLVARERHGEPSAIKHEEAECQASRVEVAA